MNYNDKGRLMIRFIKKYGYSIWLGSSLAIGDISFMTWEFYYITIPVILLVGLGYKNR